MQNDAPKPPSRRLVLANGLASGTTIGIWAITLIGQFAYSGIPANRLPLYIGAGLVGIAVSVYLGIRYLTASHRQQIHALEDELTQVRATAASFKQVIDAVQLVDQQAEVNSVRLQKIQQHLDRDIMESDTVPIAHLHSINGGGA